MILALLLVTASFRPPAPLIGDLITVEFEEAVVLDPSPDYELVEQDGRRVVLRTFRPEPFELSGRVGNVAFRRLIIPVTSVLEPDDTLQPAPLKPPVEPARSRVPLAAIGAAAGVAALAWLAVLLLARRAQPATEEVSELTAAQRFRRTVERLRRDEAMPHRWAALADATRTYLAATDARLGAELTTAEVLRADLGTAEASVLAGVLAQGDLEKFSPWGAAAGDFEAAADRALTLLREAPAAPEGT